MMEPVTEASNIISADIDLANGEDVVTILQQCDSQIFTGWKNYQSIYSHNVVSTISEVSDKFAKVMKAERGGIVLSGCGTSGRIAFVAARAFNSLTRYRKKFRYTIAGGDRALVLSTEAPEDSWTAGVNDLKTVTKDIDQVLYIGITCGLSAPYVAGQLHYCMQNMDKYTPVLLGFNPVELSRKVPIADWDRTFHDVAMAMSNDNRCYIINPIVGPEPITGSSRMKSGTITKITLETIFMTSLSTLSDTSGLIVNILAGYELAYRFTYFNSKKIADLVLAAGKSLCSGGRICYLGQDRLGIMAIIDASECPPTYGADVNDIRGFINGGWTTLGNEEGDLASKGPKFNLDLEYFQSHILPHLSEIDTIIFVGDWTENNSKLIKQVKTKKCVVGGVTVTNGNEDVDMINVAISLPYDVIKLLLSECLQFDTSKFFEEMSTKLVLNAISTGAHIAKGKVLGNRMIDLQVSNSKLYHRSIGIIQEFAKVEKEIAERYLLMSIYDQSMSLTACNEDIMKHIAAASGKSLVVPTAILMIQKKISVKEARDWLLGQPILRKALLSEHV